MKMTVNPEVVEAFKTMRARYPEFEGVLINGTIVLTPEQNAALPFTDSDIPKLPKASEGSPIIDTDMSNYININVMTVPEGKSKSVGDGWMATNHHGRIYAWGEVR